MAECPSAFASGACCLGFKQLLYLFLFPVAQGDGFQKIADEDGLLSVLVGLVEANQPISRSPALSLRHVRKVPDVLPHSPVDLIVQLLVLYRVLDEGPLCRQLIP